MVKKMTRSKRLALEKAIRIQKQNRTREAIEEIKRKMRGVTKEQWVQAVKQSRKRKVKAT